MIGQPVEEEVPINEDDEETDTDIELEKPDGGCSGGGVNKDKDDEGGDGGGNGIGECGNDLDACNEDVNGKGVEDNQKGDGGQDMEKGDGVNEEDLNVVNNVICNVVGSYLGSQGPIHLTQLWTENAPDVGSIFGSSVGGKD